MSVRVLFVCVENSTRSQMAEGFARSFGAEAQSAGSRPSGTVNPTAIEVMRELGIDISGHASKGKDSVPTEGWDWVVTMGCGDSCPHVSAKNHADWPIRDPKGLTGDDLRAVRDDIQSRVRALVDL